ncbi:hypothetical protein SUGI_0665600 [Cryptomeria japonica]|nr:hypothetical protein SUGI_0665600 [Cryptomeria japonica]
MLVSVSRDREEALMCMLKSSYGSAKKAITEVSSRNYLNRNGGVSKARKKETCSTICEVILNILLGEEFHVKISNFEMEKLVNSGHGNEWNGNGLAFSSIRGMRSYLTPEWTMNLPISVKVDVSNFGILLLELVSGWKVANFIMSRNNFDEWVFDGVRERQCTKNIPENSNLSFCYSQVVVCGDCFSWKMGGELYSTVSCVKGSLSYGKAMLVFLQEFFGEEIGCFDLVF